MRTSTRHFIDDIKDADDLGQAKNLLARVLDGTGFGTFNYVLAAGTSSGIDDARPINCNNMRADWIERYSQDRLDLNDYSFAYCQNSSTPLMWSDAQELADAGFIDTKLMHALHCGADFGISKCVLVPLPTLGGFVSGGTLVAAPETSWSETKRMFRAQEADLVHIVSAFHAHVDHAEIAIDELRLTRREIDVLRWLADGLRYDAISDRIGNRRSTVEKQVLSARRKLSSRTTEQAVARAAWLGIV
ncbi:MAG: autoinducer binding domain-containing protein [Pseudomonadota bacterium]